MRPEIYYSCSLKNYSMFQLLETGVEIMSRIIKSIALDDQTARIAESLPNFSHFVRECLYRHAVTTTLECSRDQTWLDTERCNPTVQPICFSCWPNGRPPNEAIKQFRADGLSINWLDMKARETNSYLIDLGRINRIVKESPKSPTKVGFFASIREKIRNRSN